MKNYRSYYWRNGGTLYNIEVQVKRHCFYLETHPVWGARRDELTRQEAAKRISFLRKTYGKPVGIFRFED